jgi:hypothetical protein
VTRTPPRARRPLLPWEGGGSAFEVLYLLSPHRLDGVYGDTPLKLVPPGESSKRLELVFNYLLGRELPWADWATLCHPLHAEKCINTGYLAHPCHKAQS